MSLFLLLIGFCALNDWGVDIARTPAGDTTRAWLVAISWGMAFLAWVVESVASAIRDSKK